MNCVRVGRGRSSRSAMANKIVFATSTKHDGNMSATFGLKQALDNRAQFIKKLGLNSENLIVLSQVHGNKVVRVLAKDIGQAKTNTAAASADAMIANDPSLVLAIFVADCLPVFFCDELTQSFGVAHAGRKGTIANIAAKTVQALKDNFKAQSENIKVTFGPCIHKCHYDQQLPQDKEKIEKFQTLFPNAVSEKNGKYYFNLIAANITQLIKADIKKENIDSSPSQCTACHPKLYWSYHKPQKLEGVMMGVIGTTMT